MKKSLLTIATIGLAAGAFGQGQVILDNDLGSGYVTLNSARPSGALAAKGTYQVALLWFNGTSFQQVGAVYQTGGASDGAGFFHDSTTINTPVFSSTGTFEVQGWTGNFSSYAAALAGASFVGQTPTFANAEGNPNGSPPSNPVPISQTGNAGAGWNGNLILVPVPEPSTIVLGGLGAAALLLFRRRK